MEQLYISSCEYKDFATPRRVLCYQKAKIDNRNCLIIEVDKPLIGQKYNLKDYDPDVFYLINRHDENAFDKLNVFPIHVHVLIVKTYVKLIPSSLDDLQHIAWACLYDNEEEAYKHRIM